MHVIQCHVMQPMSDRCQLDGLHHALLPGAVLYDARQLFDGHNAKADVLLRSVAGALPEAVATCLDAAGAELSPLRQAALLKVPVSHTRIMLAVR